MGESARTPALRCLPDAGRLRLTHSGETSLVTAAGSRQHAGPACTGPGDHLTSSAGECGGGTPPLMWPIDETRQLHDRHQMVSGGLRRAARQPLIVIRLLLSGCHLRPASLTTSLFWHSNATRHLPRAANHPTRLARLRPAVCRRHDHCLPDTRSLAAKGVCCCKVIIGEAASDSPTTHGLYLSVTGHFGDASVADVRLVFWRLLFANCAFYTVDNTVR